MEGTLTKEPEGLTLTYEIMYLRFIEQQGRFNLADPDDESTNWKVIIYDDGNKVVERDGVPCKLEWSLDGDKEGWFEMGDGIENLVEESWDFANSRISTRDYHAQTLAFAQTYNENKEVLISEWEVRRKKDILERIETLERALNTYELYDEPLDFSVLLGRDIERLQGRIAKQKSEVSQYKEPNFDS